MTGACAGSMGESTWIGSRWTAPTFVVWQSAFPSLGFSRSKPVIRCAPA